MIDAAFADRIIRIATNPFPGMSQEDVTALEERLGVTLSPATHEFLARISGFEDPETGVVDFSGRRHFAAVDDLPNAVPIASNYCGDCWFAEVDIQTGSFGRVLLASHDGAYRLFTDFASLEEFVDAALFDKARISARDDEVMALIGRPLQSLRQPEAMNSPDETIRAFASQLTPEHVIYDLRQRGGLLPFDNREVTRYGSTLVYAILEPPEQPRVGILRRLIDAVRRRQSGS